MNINVKRFIGDEGTKCLSVLKNIGDEIDKASILLKGDTQTFLGIVQTVSEDISVSTLLFVLGAEDNLDEVKEDLNEGLKDLKEQNGFEPSIPLDNIFACDSLMCLFTGIDVSDSLSTKTEDIYKTIGLRLSDTDADEIDVSFCKNMWNIFGSYMPKCFIVPVVTEINHLIKMKDDPTWRDDRINTLREIWPNIETEVSKSPTSGFLSSFDALANM